MYLRDLFIPPGKSSKSLLSVVSVCFRLPFTSIYDSRLQVFASCGRVQYLRCSAMELQPRIRRTCDRIYEYFTGVLSC